MLNTIDGNPCTDDECVGDGCQFPYNSAPCEDDGNPCTADVCWQGDCVHPADNTATCEDDENPCTTAQCIGGTCVQVPKPGSCSDGDACSGGESCVEGVCTGGTPVDCSAAPGVDACATNVRCESDAGCLWDWPCDDGDPCTIDSCNEQTHACQHEPVHPPSDSCAPEGCNVTLGVPERIAVNDDDDNGNGVADHEETGPVDGEDDLGQVSLTASGCGVLPECVLGFSTYVWSLVGLDSFVDAEMAARAESQPWPPPSQVYISGSYPSSECGTPVEFAMICGSGVHFCRATSPPIVVVGVGTLEWELGAEGNAPLDSCPNNGGKRVFPGKISPIDGSPGDRKKVKLVATIFPPVADVPVYFRVWDVDDPFDQLHPNMPDVNLIDNNDDGEDNRPDGETFAVVSDETDESGRAEITVTVSMQPGNNYRAAASCLQDALTQADQTDADARNQSGGGWAGYKVPVVWSEMLTVWRKLTLEVDSMDQESQSLADRVHPIVEWDRCTPVAREVDSPAAGFTTIECAPHEDHPGHPGIDNYEGGALVRNGTGEEFLIVRNDPMPIILTLWGDPGSEIVGVSCTVRDDDLFFADPTSPRQLPKTSVVDGNILDAYRQAYVEVVEAGSINQVNIVEWKSNKFLVEILYDYLNLTGISYQWDVGSSDDYWARHLVACYQPDTNVDAEGDSQENCGVSQNCTTVQVPYPVLPLRPLPNLDQVYGWTVRQEIYYDTALSTVFIETIRDNVWDWSSPKFWQFVAHEVGHSTLDQNHDQSSQDTEHNEGGLMSSGDQLQDFDQYRRFAAPTLRRFREVSRW